MARARFVARPATDTHVWKPTARRLLNIRRTHLSKLSKKATVACHRRKDAFKRPVAHRCNPARSARTTVANLRSNAVHSCTKPRQALRPFARPRRRHFRRVTVASRVKRTIAASFFDRRVTWAAQAR